MRQRRTLLPQRCLLVASRRQKCRHQEDVTTRYSVPKAAWWWLLRPTASRTIIATLRVVVVVERTTSYGNHNQPRSRC